MHPNTSKTVNTSSESNTHDPTMPECITAEPCTCQRHLCDYRDDVLFSQDEGLLGHHAQAPRRRSCTPWCMSRTASPSSRLENAGKVTNKGTNCQDGSTSTGGVTRGSCGFATCNSTAMSLGRNPYTTILIARYCRCGGSVYTSVDK